MRAIKQTSQFKRDLKREAKGPHRVVLAQDFIEIVRSLACDEPLTEKHRDHALTGEWKDLTLRFRQSAVPSEWAAASRQRFGPGC